jgi:hypothetical protein
MNLLVYLLLPESALAALPPKDASGGISLNAWFSPEDYASLGVQPANEVDYCALFQSASDKLWVSTEGQHYIKQATFMLGELQPGVRLSDGTGRAIAQHGNWIKLPHQLPLELEPQAMTLNHEMGHYFYGLIDEYVEVGTSSAGYCVDEDYGDLVVSGCVSFPESSCASGAQCAVLDSCMGGPHDGMLCDYNPAPVPANYLVVDREDCEGAGGSCLDPGSGVCMMGPDFGSPCEEHDDCTDTSYACSAQIRDETLAIDDPADESCLMANPGEPRWCGDNHRHSVTFSNALTLDMSRGILPYVVDGLFAQPDDYTCWDVAQHHFPDLSWSGTYTAEVELGLPPALDCQWAIDELDLEGSTALVVDTSGSMLYEDAWSYAIDGAEFLNMRALQEAPGSNVGLYHFDSGFQVLPHDSLSLEMGPVQDLGDGIDRDAMAAYMDPNRKTHICEALQDAAAELEGVPVTDRKIVLLTDGQDTSPGECDPVAVAADLCADGISVHALAYGAADVATTREMTEAGCGGMKFAPPGFLGLSGAHSLQMGWARIGSLVDGELELLYKREEMVVGYFGDIVDKTVEVPEGADKLVLTWMGSHEAWLGVPLFNQADYTVTSPSGVITAVAGGQAPDRARYRTLEIADPEPGTWRMTVDGTGPVLTAQIPIEVGWLATISAPGLTAEAWTLQSRGLLGQPQRVLASAGMLDEPLTGLQVSADLVRDDDRWSVDLYDDGMHGDGAHADGVYGGSFVPLLEGPYAVEVTFAALAGTSRTVPSRHAAESDFVLRADTAFQVLPGQPLQGRDVNGAPIVLPDLYQGGTYTHLRTNIVGVPLSAANTALSLGQGVEIANLEIDCLTCGTSDLHHYELYFDAVLDSDAALGLRDLVVQVGGNQYVLQDATEVIAAPKPAVFAAGSLVLSEVMTAPDVPGEWFEIYNPSRGSVDLYGLEIRDGSRAVVRVGQPLVVPGQGYALLSEEAIAGVDHVYRGLVLDATDSLELRSDGRVVDTVSWDRTFPVVTGSSMSLDPSKLDASSNDRASSWCAAPGGTPGAPNGTCSKP